MDKISLNILVLVLFFVLSGCSQEFEKGVKLIETQESLPANFNEVSFERDQPPTLRYLVNRLYSQTDFKDTWDTFMRNKDQPKVDFKKKDVIFLGLNESGSCPLKINSIKLKDKNQELHIEFAGRVGNCTSDASPRTFVLEIDKQVSKDLSNIIVTQEKVETVIPIGQSNN